MVQIPLWLLYVIAVFTFGIAGLIIALLVTLLVIFQKIKNIIEAVNKGVKRIRHMANIIRILFF